VSLERGLVTIAGTTLAAAEAQEAPQVEDEAPPPAPPAEPGEVVFSSPTDGEVDVPAGSRVRIQFSRGLNPDSLTDRIGVGYVGAPAAAGVMPPEFTFAYDAATRAVEIRFTRPLEPFRTVRVEVLDGIRTFDGAPVRPWVLTFSVGGN